MTQLQVGQLINLEKAPFATAKIRDPRQPLDLWWPYPLLLALFCLVLFFPGINSGDLWRTENLRALIAREFLRSGDWIVPRLYGEPYLTKPPGMYVAIALVSWPLGEVRTWSARLPAALAATVTVFLLYWYFARALGRKAGLIAALILPASPMWLDKASAAEIDMLQVAWVTAAILCFLRALEEDETGRRGWPWWLGAMLCLAGGVLTKWSAPVFFYLTAIPLLWWRQRLKLLLSRRHLLSGALAASLVLLWVGAAMTRVGVEPFSRTVVREGLARIYPQLYGEAYRWWLVPVHPLRLLATMLPWSLMAVLTLRPSFAGIWDARGRRLLQALHCWTWPNMLFWSFLAEHAPRHSFPLFPGIAGLAALVWLAWMSGRLRWPFPRLGPGTVLSCLVLAWLGAKIVHVYSVVPHRNDAREPRMKGLQLAALVPPGDSLYVVGLRDKDEGIIFHYGRPVHRLPAKSGQALPAERFYCLLEEYEWQAWNLGRPSRVVGRLNGETGDPLLLTRVEAADADRPMSGRAD